MGTAHRPDSATDRSVPASANLGEPAGPLGGEELKDHFLRLLFFHPRGLGRQMPRSVRTGEVLDLFTPLPQSKLPAAASFRLPDAVVGARVQADSPAIEVMTDLQRTAPVSIGRFAGVDEANLTMIDHGVRLLFVVDKRRILGLVTATDILGEKPVLLSQQRGIRHDEVMVSDIMTPTEQLDVIDLRAVLAATVRDVVATLRRSGRQHALVIDHDPDDDKVVRGIFSLTRIARQLGLAPQAPDIARTFAEIEAAFRSA